MVKVGRKRKKCSTAWVWKVILTWREKWSIKKGSLWGGFGFFEIRRNEKRKVLRNVMSFILNLHYSSLRWLNRNVVFLLLGVMLWMKHKLRLTQVGPGKLGYKMYYFTFNDSLTESVIDWEHSVFLWSWHSWVLVILKNMRSKGIVITCSVFNKEILKEACSLIVLYFPTVLIFPKGQTSLYCYSWNQMSVALKRQMVVALLNYLVMWMKTNHLTEDAETTKTHVLLLM